MIDLGATFGRVDQYLEGLLPADDEALSAALRDASAAGLPSIQVSPLQGRLLHLLARSVGARRILEVGTLGAYSTIWLARALVPGGHLITLEIDPKHARVAQANIARAGLSEVVELRLGPALNTLDRMLEASTEPFDFIFLDADKPNNEPYLDRAVRMSRSGSLIVIDNVVRRGAVVDAASDDAKVQGTRRALAALGRDPRVEATIIQTVGSKGHDGFALARVR